MDKESTQSDERQEIKGAAFKLLARREYCRAELEQKFYRKYAHNQVDSVLDKMEQDGYLSDQRFVEMFVRGRLAQGYGLKKIQYDLQQKKTTAQLLEDVLDELAPDWYELAQDAWSRRFREPPKGDYKVFGKQMRYLLQRGFSMDEARAAIDEAPDYD